MEVDYKNAEGYADPTYHDAIMNIVKWGEESKRFTFRPIVFICYQDAENKEETRNKVISFCRYACDLGYIPVAAQLMFPEYLEGNSEENEQLIAFMSLVLLTKCAETWVLGSVITDEMKKEINRARLRRQKVRYFSFDHKEVSRT